VLQDQRGSERYDLTVGRRISKREIETQKESRRGFPGGKSRLRGSRRENIQEGSRDSKESKRREKMSMNRLRD